MLIAKRRIATIATAFALISLASPAHATGSSDATLTSLTISSGTLSPGFASGTYSYSAITTAVSVTVTSTSSQTTSTMTVSINGTSSSIRSRVASGSLGLALGLNSIITQVTAPDGVTTANYSITVSRTLAAPTGVSATAGAESATVTWAGPSGAATYTVTASPGGFTCTATDPTTSCSITGLADGTVYTFTVIAANGNVISDSSSASNGVSPLGPLTAPTNVTAVAGNGSAVVSWSASPRATLYAVTSSPGGFTCTTHSTKCTVSSLTNGTAYTFMVIASNSLGSSGSSAASSPVTPMTVPGNPTAVSASAGIAQATVSWTAPASNGGSTITSYTATSAPGGLTCLATAPTTACTITGLTYGTSYAFTVTATNSVGSSFASDPSSAIVPLPSTDSVLAGLSLSAGTLSPAFAVGTTSYMATENSLQTSVTVSATALQASASIQISVNGSGYSAASQGSASAMATLNVGANSISVKVTAQDGVTTSAYSITVNRDAPPAVILPIATDTTAATTVASPGSTSTITARVATANGPSSDSSSGSAASPDSVTVVVPANAISAATTFSVYSYRPTAATDTGFVAVRVEANTVGDNTAIRTFARPLQIQFSKRTSTTTQSTAPAWSRDGQSWTLIPRLASLSLQDGQSDGYFVNPDGSNSILTRHLTIFAQLANQKPVAVTTPVPDIARHAALQLTADGGSGTGAIKFASESPEICSVTADGSVTGIGLGTCQVTATRLASGVYLDATSMPIAVVIWPTKMDVIHLEHYRDMHLHWSE